MKIKGLIWIDEIIDKLDRKHHVSQKEVLEILTNRPHFRFIEKGHRLGENVYAALGQTKNGRYLKVSHCIFYLQKRRACSYSVSQRYDVHREEEI